MKLIWIVLLCFSSLAIFGVENKEIIDAKKQLLQSLKIYDASIIGLSKDHALKEIYAPVLKSINEGKVVFDVSNIEKSPLEAYNVIYKPQTKSFYIPISISVFRADKQYPGYLLTVLAGAMVTLKKEITSAVHPYNPDGIQIVFDSLDVLYAQTSSLNDLTSQRTGKFHPFENFLIESLKTDQSLNLAPMSNASIFLIGIDSQIIFSLVELGGSAKSKSSSFKDYMERVTALATRLENSITTIDKDTKVDDKLRYISIISAYTFMKYGIALVNDQLNRFYSAEMKLKENESFLEKLNKISDSLDAEARKHTKWLSYKDYFAKTILK